MAVKPGSPRVVITGIGLRTGLGGERETTWSAMRAGSSAARVLDRVPAPAEELPYVAYPSLHPDSRGREHFFKAAIEAVGDAHLGKDFGHPIDRIASEP